MKPISPKMIFQSTFSSSYVFGHLSTSLINISTETFPWNKIYKTPTFTGIHPHETILTMLEAIGKSLGGVTDEVSGNIVV